MVTFVGGWGHAEPLLPLARLAESHGGHRVTFVGQAAVVPRLESMGFRTIVVGPDTLGHARLPLVAVDRNKERAVMRDHFFAWFGAVRAIALVALFTAEQPRLVVCDEVDVGAVIAAERLGIACVTVSVTAAGRLAHPSVVGPAWNQLRADHGLPDDPDGDRMGGTLRLIPAPRSFRDPRLPLRGETVWCQPPVLEQAWRTQRQRSIVYGTLGTVFNVESGDLLSRLVHAFSRLNVEALVTTGPHIQRHELPDAPERVQVKQFVPQHEVLVSCRAVVCHGGSGTVIASLSVGVPVVLLPMGADQPDNADRCQELGVGLVLDPLRVQPQAIADAVTTVMDERGYAQAASRLASEADAQPQLHHIAELLALLEPGHP